MAGRSLRVQAVAALTPLTVAIVVAAGTVAASSTPPVPLHVLLTLSSHLPSMARQALVTEAERIWRDEHVNIEWAQPGHLIEDPDGPLRVLVISRPDTASTSRRWPVAELFPEAEPRAFAIAWIDGAARVVDEAARSADLDAPTPREYRLGLVLGRAVAHEIGHFLLATGTHAESGLMRAAIDASEFAGVGGETFRLDRNASEWLRQRVSTQGGAVAKLRADGFSYARQPATAGPATGETLLRLNAPR
jgi:hypothetical protein